MLFVLYLHLIAPGFSLSNIWHHMDFQVSPSNKYFEMLYVNHSKGAKVFRTRTTSANNKNYCLPKRLVMMIKLMMWTWGHSSYTQQAPHVLVYPIQGGLPWSVLGIIDVYLSQVFVNLQTNDLLILQSSSGCMSSSCPLSLVSEKNSSY